MVAIAVVSSELWWRECTAWPAERLWRILIDDIYPNHTGIFFVIRPRFLHCFRSLWFDLYPSDATGGERTLQKLRTWHHALTTRWAACSLSGKDYQSCAALMLPFLAKSRKAAVSSLFGPSEAMGSDKLPSRPQFSRNSFRRSLSRIPRIMIMFTLISHHGSVLKTSQFLRVCYEIHSHCLLLTI